MGRSCSSACRDDSIDWCRMSVNGWEEVVICLQKKRVGGTCRLRTRSSPLLDIHHAHVRVDVCRTSAEVLPEGGSSQWRGHGHHTMTCIRIPTSYLCTTPHIRLPTLQVPPTLHLTTSHHFHTTINTLPPPPAPPPPPPSPPSSTRLPTGASRLRHDSRVN